MAGINRFTGKMLDGWAHVAQSIGVLITTALQSRVMRRDVGSGLPRLVDAPMSPATLIEFYAATAGAVRKYEPRFRIVRMNVARLEDGTPDIAGVAAGRLGLFADGIYFPRGHLGDFSISEPKRVTVPL